MKSEERIPLALFLLRLGVFVVMFVWTLDKFVNTAHTTKVYDRFYFIGGLDDAAFYVIGAIELLVIAGFVLGYKKRWTYGAVLLFHAISTLSSYQQYLAPFEKVNLFFFAAWPMLAACFALYYLRDLDTKWAIDKSEPS